MAAAAGAGAAAAGAGACGGGCLPQGLLAPGPAEDGRLMAPRGRHHRAAALGTQRARSERAADARGGRAQPPPRPRRSEHAPGGGRGGSAGGERCGAAGAADRHGWAVPGRSRRAPGAVGGGPCRGSAPRSPPVTPRCRTAMRRGGTVPGLR